MKRILDKITILTMFVLALACTDESLDPFILNDIQKGSILALRGDDGSSGNLNPDQNFFFKDLVQTTDEFHYVADFISEDQSLLQSIQVYARILTGPRSLVATVDASGWTIPTGGNSKQGEVRVPLDDILTALSITDPTTLGRTDLIVESDILLTDGTTVPAAAIVNTGLFAAAAFFPAHALNYYAEVQTDFRPVATTKIAGEFVVSGTTVTRPVFPLKAGSKDTLYVTYDQDLINTPTITYNNAAITGAGVVKVDDDEFYEIVTAGAGFTGAVTATVTGGQANTFGPTLTQASKTQTINVDNTTPQVASTTTGTRVGNGQLATITVTFNEKMSAKSANAIKISIDDPNDGIKDVDFVDTAFPANMTLAANGLSASYVYLVEAIAPLTHDVLVISFTGGADEAGNAVAGGIPNAALTLDVRTPPQPTMVLDGGGHDLGTQIKWSGAQGDGGAPTGSTTGTLYFVAVDAGSAAPTDVDFDQDDNAVWTMATGVTQRTTGKLTMTSGSTGTQFTSFTPNGTFDIYAVFKGSTGNVSAIGAAVLTNVVMN